MNSVTINTGFGKRYRRKSHAEQLQKLGWLDEEHEKTPEPPKKEPVIIMQSKPKPAKIKQTKEQKIKGAKYYNLACGFLNRRENKRFGLEAAYDKVLLFFAREKRQNYIVKLTEDSKARTRAYDKFGIDKEGRYYKLNPHTEKRGKDTQAWVIGNPTEKEKDLKRAFIGGPEQFYLPPEVYHLAYEIIKELHWAFLYYFDKRPDNGKINARMSLLADKLKRKVRLPGMHSSNSLRILLFSIVSAGRTAWARNFGFANKVGRPKKVNDTRLAVRFAHTTKGQVAINEHMTKVSKQMGIALRDKTLARGMKAEVMTRICTWAIKPERMIEIKLRDEAGDKLDQAKLLQKALEDTTPLLQLAFKKAKKQQVWQRRDGEKRYPQTAKNSPPYLSVNKYYVSKERICDQCGVSKYKKNEMIRGVVTEICVDLA